MSKGMKIALVCILILAIVAGVYFYNQKKAKNKPEAPKPGAATGTAASATNATPAAAPAQTTATA